jgi:hypothetical protein
MTSVVFLVHGMGTHGADWADAGVALLKSCATQYPKTQDGGIWEDIQFEPLTYGQHFDAVLQDWGQLTQAILRDTPADQQDSLSDLLTQLDGSRGGFLWTHVMDVVLWRFHAHVRNLILSDLGATLLEKISAHAAQPGAVPRFSVFAHSLGTSVTHDLVQALSLRTLVDASGAPISDPGWAPPRFRFATLALFANVSRVLEREAWKVYDEPVRPSADALDARSCQTYLSFEHVLDPFTRPAPFDSQWPEDGYLRVRVNHLRQVNVHAFEHFLAHPAVHIPVLRSLFGFSCVSPTEAKSAVDDYDRLPSSIPEAKAAALRALHGDAGDWKSLVAAWSKFLTL